MAYAYLGDGLRRFKEMKSASLYRWISKLHVYFGLFISPFVLVFAVSAIMFNHMWGAESKGEVQKRQTSIEMPENVEGLEIARHIMRQVDVSGEVEFFRHDTRSNIVKRN